MIRIGIIGCGYWGINYVRVFSELPDVTVACVCDTSEDRLRIMHRKFPYVFPTKLLEELLADEQVDAVVVATEASTHYSITKACLLHNKHVLVEKPLTTSIEEGEELVKLAEEKKIKLMVGHTFLYNPAIRKIKEYLSDDDVGSIYYLEATRTHLGLIRKDVNAIWDLAPHDISIFSFLLEAQPFWVSAVSGGFLNNGRPDVGFITLGYPHNILGHIHVSWINSNKVREISVVGSKKRIVFDDLNSMERVRIFEKGAAITGEADSFGEFQLQLRDGDIISPRIDTSEPLKNQCNHFISCLSNGRHPLTDGTNGLNVVRVMEAVNASLKQRGAPVEISRAFVEVSRVPVEISN
ncbi:MAG: oxidoreductase [Candidatus Scalindua rubra]|uniref:Oxidoreductase n=1 Tax=Candidatus Scalindua rubra TaxID=1872076 RepID=A0A1E3XE22_9BACT|nr:MAG: oxidoreductase [Candidatus Scalindua rubra]